MPHKDARIDSHQEKSASHLFAYGSLMCPDILARVAGLVVDGQPAELTGYRRRAVRGETYPGLIVAPGHVLGGVLYRALPEAAWARLDQFEGDDYQRIKVEIRSATGPLPAWTYLYRPELHHQLEDHDWDFQAFLQTGKHRFEAGYLGFRQIGPVG